MKNKIKIFLLTLSNEKKKKYLIYGISFFLLIIISIFGYSFFKKENKIDNSSLLNNVNIGNQENVEKKEEKKELTSGDNGIVKTLLRNIEKENKNIYFDENKIKKIFSNSNNIKDLIFKLLEIKDYNNSIVNSINKEFKKKYNEDLNLQKCKKDKCSKIENLAIINNLYNVLDKSKKTKEEFSNIQNSLSSNNLYGIKKELDKKYECVDKNKISLQINKIKISKKYKNTEVKDKIKLFPNILKFDLGPLFSYKIKLDELLRNDNLLFLDLKQIKDIKNKGKVINKKILFGDKYKTVSFYLYKDLYFEKYEIDKILKYITSDFYKITRNNKYGYVFGYDIQNTEKGKIKIGKPKLILLKDNNLSNTIMYLFLNEIKNNCNAIGEYPKNINELISAYIKYNKKLMDLGLNKKEYIQYKIIKEVLNTIFINN